MDLATRIGANPAKLAGTRTNISFLGKGPSKNPLFQNRLAGLDNASPQNLGKTGSVIRSDRRCCRLGERRQTQQYSNRNFRT